MELENKQRSSSGISVEQNPLIKEMGGMPLEVISAEWRDHIEGAVLDKSELENIVNKKLKDRAELANKLKLQHKLKHRLFFAFWLAASKNSNQSECCKQAEHKFTREIFFIGSALGNRKFWQY